MDPQPLQQTLEIRPAPDSQIRDGFRAQQCACERFHCADIRSGTAGLDRDANASSRDLGACLRDNPAVANPLVDWSCASDDEVEGLPGLGATEKCRRQVSRDNQPVRRGALEFGADFGKHRGDRASRPDPDVGGNGRAGIGQSGGQDEDDDAIASHLTAQC
jgi:hypothetical protein